MSCHHHDLGSTSDRSYREKYFLQPITNIRWLVGTKHVQNPKTLLRIQNTFESPKHFPQSKTLRSENPKALVIIQNTSPKPKTLLGSGKCFGFGDMFLDSGTCFWILGRVLDFVKCFFLFWDELWILGSVLSLSDTVQTLPRSRQ